MRRVSFKILYDVFYNETLLSEAVNKYFESNSLKDDDKAFIKRETAGVIEKIDDIDAYIAKYSKTKISKLNKDILVVLRLGVYEMKYMDKVPAYATINEYVNIIKKSKSRKLSGYVNGVLRNISRDIGSTEMIIDDAYKRNQEKNCYFKIFNDKENEVLTELNSKAIKYDKYNGNLDYNYAHVYKVNKYKDIIDTESFRKGHVLIEDASSVFMVDKLTSYTEKMHGNMIDILDTCSAPGGKILSLIDNLLLSGKEYSIDVTACDISDDKIAKITENVERLNLCEKENVKIDIFVKDATKLEASFCDRFDFVICDVPCTGLGVISKKPDIKLNYSEEKKMSLVKIQRLILDVSKNYVKDGGILSYSTCTTTKEENEDNIEYFLDNNKNYKKLYEKKIDVNDANLADGFYMCFMKKNG